MATNSSEFSHPGIPCTTSAAVTAGRFGTIAGTTSRTVAQSGAGAATHGVIGDSAGSGTSVPLHTSGRGYLTVNAQSTNIAPGDKLGATTNGVGVKATADKAAFGAIALEPASTDGAIIEVLITGLGYIGA